MKESLVNVGIGITALYGALEVSRCAFTKSTRKEILKRDNRECVGLYGNPCYFENIYGQPASEKLGYYLTAAHFPHVHGKHNDEKDYGRCLCVACHASEELIRNNKWGAKQLLSNGIYNYSFVEKNGFPQQHLTVEDIGPFIDKMRPFYEEYLYNLPAQV